MSMNKNLGMLLLGIWLIVTGLMHVVSFAVPPIGMALLAIIACVLILIGR